MAEKNFNQRMVDSAESKNSEQELLAAELHGLLTQMSLHRIVNDNSGTLALKAQITDWVNQIPNSQSVIEHLSNAYCGEVIEAIKLFPNLDKNHLIDTILQRVGTGFGHGEVLQLLDSPDLHDLTKDKLRNLVSPEWIGKLQNLGPDFLNALTTSPEFNAVKGKLGMHVMSEIAKNVTSFDKSCHPEIARILSADGHEEQIHEHLDKFNLRDADDMRAELRPADRTISPKTKDLLQAMHSMKSFSNLDKQELINLVKQNEWALPYLIPFITDLRGEDISEILRLASENNLLDLSQYLLKYDFDAILMIAENGFDVRCGDEGRTEVRQALLGAGKMFAEAGCPRMLSMVAQVTQLMMTGGEVDKELLLNSRTEEITPYQKFDLSHLVANFYLRDLFYKEYIMPIEAALVPQGGLLVEGPNAYEYKREGNGLAKEPQEFRSMTNRIELAQLTGFRDKEVDLFFDESRQFVLYAIAGEVESILPIYDKNHEFAVNVDRLISNGNIEDIQKFLMRSIMVLAKHDSKESYRAGEAWVKISELAMNMWGINPDKRLLLDRVIDIQHNGGRIFDKNDHGRIFNTEKILAKGESSLLEYKKHAVFERLLEYCVANDLISEDEVKEYQEMQNSALSLLGKARNDALTVAASYE